MVTGEGESSLSGVRVVELASSLAGPYIGMCLGDMGADVIKVENPRGGDMSRHWSPPGVAGESGFFLSANRNKRSIALDLQSDSGRDVLMRMVDNADVVIDNFRPGSSLHEALNYSALSKNNSALVMVHISAFGDTGPWRDRPGYDLVAQATGGLMSVTGEPQGPPLRAGFSVADVGAGLFGLAGVLAALVERARTGRGRYVSTSLFEGQLGMHVNAAVNMFLSGEVPQRFGATHPNLSPYQVFVAGDGHLVIAAGNDRLYQRLCVALGKDELAGDPRFGTNADRVTRRAELTALIEPLLAGGTVAHWCAVLEEHGVPAAPILDLGEVYAHPHTKALGMVHPVQHATAGEVPQVASPLSMDGERLAPRTAPPTLGQHTTEILTEFGVDERRQSELRAAGTVH